MGELLKFFGVLILITRFEFSNRRGLWIPNSNSWFIPTLAIGMTTGVSKHWFDILHANMTLNDQPETQPEGMSSEKYQWRLVDDFEHWRACFRPSEMINPTSSSSDISSPISSLKLQSIGLTEPLMSFWQYSIFASMQGHNQALTGLTPHHHLLTFPHLFHP
jgi:hypothetical protein